MAAIEGTQKLHSVVGSLKPRTVEIREGEEYGSVETLGG
jgi:hypothetical protein